MLRLQFKGKVVLRFLLFVLLVHVAFAVDLADRCGFDACAFHLESVIVGQLKQVQRLLERGLVDGDAGVEHIEGLLELAAVEVSRVLHQCISTPRKFTRSKDDLRCPAGNTCESRKSRRFCSTLSEDKD